MWFLKKKRKTERENRKKKKIEKRSKRISISKELDYYYYEISN